MSDINSSAVKCREIIHRLCRRVLAQDATTKDQQASSIPMFDPLGSTMPAEDFGDISVDSWMAEIDTAIDGYDMYCDHLINVPMPGMGGPGDADSTDPGSSTDWPFSVTDLKADVEPGGRQWDWGLMLMQ